MSLITDKIKDQIPPELPPEGPSVPSVSPRIPSAIPTLTSPVSPIRNPSILAPESPLQQLNGDLSALRKALEGSSDEDLILLCADKVLEQTKELLFSEECLYDLSRTYYLLNKCLDAKTSTLALEWTASERAKIEEAFQKLEEFRLNIQDTIQKIGNDFYEKDQRSGLGLGGTCTGTTLVHLSQSTPVIDEETARKARFFHGAGQLNMQFEETFYDFSKIGKDVLARRKEFFYVIKKTALIMGYEGREEQFLQETPPEILHKLLGKTCGRAHHLLVEKLNSIDSKKEALEKQIEDLQKEIAELSKLNTEEAASQIKKKKQELKECQKRLLELDALGTAISARNTALVNLIVSSKKEPSSKSVSFPEKILKKHGIAEKEVIIADVSLPIFHEKLKQLKDEKGQYYLLLNSPRKDESERHAIYISFDPPCLRDIDDLTASGKSILRTFSTTEQLIAFLPDYFAKSYGRKYESAELIQFERIPNADEEVHASQSRAAPQEAQQSPQKTPSLFSSFLKALSLESSTRPAIGLI